GFCLPVEAVVYGGDGEEVLAKSLLKGFRARLWPKIGLGTVVDATPAGFLIRGLTHRCRRFHLYTAEVFSDLYVLNLNEMEWKRVERKSDIPWPSARYDHSATLWGDDKLVVFGGSDAEDVFLNDLYVLHIPTLTWSQPEVWGPLPTGRMKHSAVINSDRLYIHGGWRANELASSHLNILHLSTSTWSPPIQITPRYGHFTAVHRSCLYAYGGMLATMDRATDITIVDLEDGCEESSVRVRGNEAPPMLGQHFAGVCGERIVVVVAPSIRQMDGRNGEVGVSIAEVDGGDDGVEVGDAATGGGEAVAGNDGHYRRRGVNGGPMLRSRGTVGEIGRAGEMMAIPHGTGVWSLHLDKMRWKMHTEEVPFLPEGSWHYYAMGRDDGR
ncbi:hypothetical protein HK101_006361, partial [Irineochytrium annulatum]